MIYVQQEDSAFAGVRFCVSAPKVNTPFLSHTSRLFNTLPFLCLFLTHTISAYSNGSLSSQLRSLGIGVGGVSARAELN